MNLRADGRLRNDNETGGTMGKLVVTEFVTLDGVMQDPGGSEGFARGGWALTFDRGPEGDAFKYEELMASDVQLLGRKTYDGFAKAWPAMTELGEFAAKMNGMPKVVVSSTLTDPTWASTTVIGADDLGGEVAKLKAQYDGDILVAGSAQLVQQLLADDLVDELRLMVFPIVLGEGKRLFADAAPQLTLRLVGTQQTGAAVVATYARAA
jgi:dihydrofolate reductase